MGYKIYRCVERKHGWHRGVKDTKSDLNMYGRTKVFNLMTSAELNRRLAASGVVSLARPCSLPLSTFTLSHLQRHQKL